MKFASVLWLLKRVRKRIPALAVLSAAQVGQALFSVFFALGTRGVIDAAISGDLAAFWHACAVQGGIIGGILFCQTLIRHLRDRLVAELDRDWKRQLLHRLLHGDYAAVSAYHSAELLNRLNNDVQKVNSGVINIVPGFASMATRLVAAVVVLGTMDARFTVLIAGMGIVVVAVTALIRRKLKDLNKRVSEHDGRVSGFMQEAMEKLLMVQAMDVSDEMERRSEKLMAERYEVQRVRKNVSLVSNSAVSLMYYGAGFLALCWCAWRMLHGQMSFGSLTAVTQLVNQLQTPFVNLSGIMPQYVAMTASAERLQELERDCENADRRDSETVSYGAVEAVCARDVYFSYGRDLVLAKSSFRLPKGAFAVVTGPSGVGKSTLLKLLLGIFRPGEGELFLQCADRRVDLGEGTRKLFAYVPQGNLLLSGTLRENLLLTRPEATEEEIQQAVYVSCMDQYLPQLPQGLETMLGENAHGLSEGQAQRLSIARAVLGGAPILLLDECTSALDARTEETVLQRLRQLPGKTCIAVTHRPAALALADWELQVSADGIRCQKLLCSDYR